MMTYLSHTDIISSENKWYPLPTFLSSYVLFYMWCVYFVSNWQLYEIVEKVQMYFNILRVTIGTRYDQAHCQEPMAPFYPFWNKNLEEQLKYTCQDFLCISLSAKYKCNKHFCIIYRPGNQCSLYFGAW